MRHFNTSGPVRPEHYQIPPLRRAGVPDLVALMEQADSFLLHAPRQSGKTSALLALRDELNHRRYRAVYCSVEMARVAGDHLDVGMRAVLSELSERARIAQHGDFPQRRWARDLAETTPTRALQQTLSRWAAASPAPLVILVDEIDSLRGKMLLSVLSQLQAVRDEKTRRSPVSVVLCGLRNPLDDSPEVGRSFDLTDRTQRLGDFSEVEVRELLGQHTAETGQPFTGTAHQDVWAATRGQPWLVNALAEESCFEPESGRDRSRAITDDDMAAAKERLILRHPSHFRHLTDRLRDDRVRRVIDPILAGYGRLDGSTDDDASYVQDLGFTAPNALPKIANPIYEEVIPRLLGSDAAVSVRLDSTTYRRPDGGLEVSRLLTDFQNFFRENAEWWSRASAYRKSAAQLLLHAYLHQAVNAGGQIAPEYGLSGGRTDLHITWKRNGGNQVFVIECKVRRSRDGIETLIADGIRQTARYAAGCGAEEGHLVVFDQDPKRSWDQKIFRRKTRVRKSKDGVEWEIVEAEAEAEPDERLISIWGM